MPSTVVHQQWSTLSAELAQCAEKIGNSVVCIHSHHRHAASGVVWQKGAIVTANHALTRPEVTVTNAQGQSFTAEVAGQDPTTDLAVLKIPESAEIPRQRLEM